MFGVIYNFERRKEYVVFWLDYLWWSLMLWSQFAYVIVFFSEIAKVV